MEDKEKLYKILKMVEHYKSVPENMISRMISKDLSIIEYLTDNDYLTYMFLGNNMNCSSSIVLTKKGRIFIFMFENRTLIAKFKSKLISFDVDDEILEEYFVSQDLEEDTFDPNKFVQYYERINRKNVVRKNNL